MSESVRYDAQDRAWIARIDGRIVAMCDDEDDARALLTDYIEGQAAIIQDQDQDQDHA